jgi:hypothetical protein
MTTPPSAARSGLFGRASKILLALVGAGVLYVVVPAVSHLPDAPAMAENHYAGVPEWGISQDFARRHPLLFSLALQASAADYVVTHGRSTDSSFGQGWLLSDAVVQSLTTPRAGTSGLLITECNGTHRTTNLLTVAAEPGHLASEARRNVFVAREGTNLFEANGKAEMATEKLGPWWHIPSFGLVRGLQDRRAEVAKAFPELNTDCAGVVSPSASLAETLQQFPELDGLKSWQDKSAKLPAQVALASLGVGDAAVSRDFSDPLGAELQLSVSAKDAGTATALKTAYGRLTAQLATKATAHRVTHTHMDGNATALAAYTLKDGVAQASYATRSGETTLRLTWRERVSVLAK